MKKYNLERHGNLLYANAAINGDGVIVAVKMLIDTGSNYTILPFETLIKIGRDPSFKKPTVQIVAANSMFVAPKVEVEWIHAFGLKFDNFSVLAHNLPASFYGDGVLGMDFLTRANATIDIAKRQFILHLNNSSRQDAKPESYEKIRLID